MYQAILFLPLIVIIWVHINGIRKKGAGAYFSHFVQPYKALLPLNIVEEIVKARLRGVKVLVLNALFRTAHPTHLSIPEAVAVAAQVGAERTFLTHLTHDNFHADLESELPRGVAPAFDGLAVKIG